MRKLPLILLSFLLTSCSLFPSNSSNSNNGNSGNNSTQNNYTYRIERKQEYGIVDYEYAFTNSLTAYQVVEISEDGSEKVLNGSFCSWSIKDRDMASVDSSGNVTPKKNGNTSIVVKAGGVTTSLDIKIATYAKTYAIDESFNEYRVGNTYNMPLVLTTNYQNNNPVTIFYTLSNDNVIEVDKNLNKFRVINSGTVDVHTEFYINSYGEKDHLDFTIVTSLANAPYFKYKNSKALTGEVSVAKNKYTSLPLDTFDITAFTYDDTNITSQIQIDTNNYNLGVEGTYNIKLSVTDTRYDATSYFVLKLEVTEYELKTTKSPYDAVSYYNYTVRQESDSPYSLAIDRLVFDCDVTLNSKYDTSDATVYCSFCFEIQNWGHYRTYDYIGGAEQLSQKFTFNGARTVHFSYTFQPSGDLDPNTFINYGPNVYINGNVYNLIYY